MQLEIEQKHISASLRQDNPWWNASQAPESIFSRRRAYFENFLSLVQSQSVRRSVILLGPRRVGKTVMLRQMIEELIKLGYNPKRLFFCSIDTPLYSGMHLEQLLQLFRDETSCDPNEHQVVVFDEIQYLKDWEVHLKVLTDRNPNTKFVASGSAAAALRLKSQESGAGRFTEFFLPPLTFSEFLYFVDMESKLIRPRQSSRTIRYETDNIAILNELFIDYLNFGGYPEAVLNDVVRGNTSRYLGRDIIDKVLLRDLPSLYGIQDIPELNRLFMKIAYHSGQEISLENLASSSGIAKNTIKRYLEYLEAAFLIVRVRKVDETGKTFVRERHFKAYLTNPSMRAALFAPLTEEDDAMGNMAETAIFSQWFHSDEMANIHYARWKQSRDFLEVDLVKVDSARMKPVWAYEIKWSDRYVDQPGELKGLVAFAKKSRPAAIPCGASTRTLTAVSNVDGVEIQHFPCALHCYQIGKNISENRPP